MSSLRSLYQLLSPLGIYALGQNSLIDRELEAYGAGFALLEEAIRQLEEDLFVQTAQGQALSLHEEKVGLSPREGASAQERRNLILSRQRRLPLPSPGGVLELLERAGLLEPQFYEEMGRLYLTAGDVADCLDAGRAWDLALQGLPAHLEVLIAPEGRDWNALMALLLNWDAFDSLNRSWDALSIIGLC